MAGRFMRPPATGAARPAKRAGGVCTGPSRKAVRAGDGLGDETLPRQAGLWRADPSRQVAARRPGAAPYPFRRPRRNKAGATMTRALRGRVSVPKGRRLAHDARGSRA